MLRIIWTQKEYLLEFNMLNTLESLFNLARQRKKTPVDGSYTNKLLSDKSLSKEKVLEEIDELIEAARSHVFDRVDENRNFHGNYEINYRINK